MTAEPIDRTAFETVPSLSIEHVLSVTHWADYLFSFTASRPASFRFRSGEFVMLGLPNGGRPLLRAYSIASPSYADELEFLSIKVAEGPLTSRLQFIEPGDPIYLGKKPVGTLVANALLPGKRLFMIGTGTGLAPFLSVARDPDIYERFSEIIVVHCVRRVEDLAYRKLLESQLAGDPLVQDEALLQFHYIPTVTREPFHRQGRVSELVEDGRLFESLTGPRHFDPKLDRVMLCGSIAMIKDFSADLEARGFEEGSNSSPGHIRDRTSIRWIENSSVSIGVDGRCQGHHPSTPNWGLNMKGDKSMIDEEFEAHSIVVRLFRRWAASEQAVRDSLGDVLEITRSLRRSDELGQHCVSLFLLLENYLGRRMESECCCSKSLSPDEHALMGVLHVAANTDRTNETGRTAHGLPIAISLSATAIRRELRLPPVPALCSDEECSPYVNTDPRPLSAGVSSDEGHHGI